MTFFSNEGRKRRKKETNSKSRPTPYPQQPNQQKISYPPNLPSPPSTAQLPYYRQQGPYHTHYANPSTPNLRPSPGPVNSRSNLRETLTNQAGKSVTQLRTKTSQFLDSRGRSCQALNSGAALCDIISSKLDAIITSIDDERFSGTEQDLQFPSAAHDAYHGAVGAQYSADAAARSRGMFGTNLSPANANSLTTINSVNGAGGRRGSNHFAKVWLYTNSRLPPHLPPFKVYLPTWPLICLAATYSESVYSPPPPSAPHPSATKTSTTTHIPPSIRTGTKATVLKSLPIDSMHTIIFSIRGTSTFMDWAVNYNSKPASPAGFLDDPGNACHAGFLHVARQMVPKVSQRLREMLEEQPSRRGCSLLITGHSAGGAVAALLYAHMMSRSVESELTRLTSMFKRVHCVTFGAPPVSLLSLQKREGWRWRKSLFYSFINEGDPVPRADKQAVRSLLRLYATPAPSVGGNGSSLSCPVTQTVVGSLSKLNLSAGNGSNATVQSNAAASSATWTMPPTTLSTAGRLIVIRHRNGNIKAHEDDIEAVTVDDELLRTVVYGDPVMHMMTLYKKRVEVLATRAVTAGGY